MKQQRKKGNALGCPFSLSESAAKKYFIFLSGFSGIFLMKRAVAGFDIPGFSLFLPCDGE